MTDNMAPAQIRLAAERYEYVRTLSPRGFSELYTTALATGVPFDVLVDGRIAERRANQIALRSRRGRSGSGWCWS